MEIVDCSECGYNLTIDEDAKHVRCPDCGAYYNVIWDWDTNYPSLELVDYLE